MFERSYCREQRSKLIEQHKCVIGNVDHDTDEPVWRI
jgi:hypothetical protein